MVEVSEKFLHEFKSRLEQPLHNLPITVVSKNTAIVNDEEFPVQFDFVTDTYVDHKKREITTHITEIIGTIPGIITVSGYRVVPQHIKIQCEYEILHISNQESQTIFEAENPLILYSDWLLEAIENEILILEVKAQHGESIDWPVGIKNAYYL